MKERGETHTTTLRLPRELKRWLGVKAAREMRSVNSEIVVVLNAAMASDAEGASARGTPAAAPAHHA
ncbi:Arc family DNA-binding protein [Falsiroseomonas sp.]|uniref:Arc family DNA-binding protein n=1 Tax=Falsiroseomonas sp. TaxID=2870721 RepID=UPI0027174A60|nr:Arc family DNA-binding protein [Falsiroseomonas sp.]MDO9502149.1 Arc family DNA-binding protein [Falsiroseomonas sp.]